MKDFFKILSYTEIDASSFEFKIEINAGHKVFEGHFPGLPVVPGVCTMTIVRECVSSVVGRKLRYGSVRECKFLEAIVPSEYQTVSVVLRIDNTEEDKIKFAGEVLVGEKKMVKIKAALV